MLLYCIVKDEEDVKNNERIQLYDFAGELLLHNTYIQQNCVDLFIPSEIKIKSLNNKDKLLCKYINKDKMLLFVFSSQDCSQCIDYELELISKNQGDIGEDKILIIASGFSSRIIAYFKSTYNLKCEFLIADDKKLCLPADNVAVPYYVLCDSELRILDLFIPSKDLPSYNEKFFINIKRRLKNEN